MIRLAMPDSDMKKRLQEAQMMQMQAPNYAGQNFIQTAPTQPTVMQQAGDMVVDRAISKGMEQVGKEGLKKGLATAGAAAGGPMGAIAGEVAGELAAPLLKDMLYSLFATGGFVGPLAPTYKNEGGIMPVMDTNDTMMGLMRLYGMR